MVLGSGQEQWQNNNEERRIYSVTDGLKSKQTAKVYRSTFKEFIKYLQNVDLRVLLDFRLDICSVQVHYSAIHHFFEINDVALNSRKIKKFLPSNDSYREDRPYSIEEISRMLGKCDIRQRVIILLLASTGMRVGAVIKNRRYQEI